VPHPSSLPVNALLDLVRIYLTEVAEQRLSSLRRAALAATAALCAVCVLGVVFLEDGALAAVCVFIATACVTALVVLLITISSLRSALRRRLSPPTHPLTAAQRTLIESVSALPTGPFSLAVYLRKLRTPGFASSELRRITDALGLTDQV
jgi:hypothetical protein